MKLSASSAPFALLPSFLAVVVLTSCGGLHSPREGGGGGGGGQTQISGRLQSGDIVFQDSSPHSNQAEAIKALTRSQWSHCGIYFENSTGGVVIDGNGRQGPVSWEVWRRGGSGGRYAAYRSRRGLSPGEVATLRRMADRYDRRPYDLKFAWDDRAIYCSELIWKAWVDALREELCPRGRLGDFNLRHAVALPLITREGSWGSVANAEAHANEPVVSPQAIVESTLLVPVP